MIQNQTTTMAARIDEASVNVDAAISSVLSSLENIVSLKEHQTTALKAFVANFPYTDGNYHLRTLRYCTANATAKMSADLFTFPCVAVISASRVGFDVSG